MEGEEASFKARETSQQKGGSGGGGGGGGGGSKGAIGAERGSTTATATATSDGRDIIISTDALNASRAQQRGGEAFSVEVSTFRRYVRQVLVEVVVRRRRYLVVVVDHHRRLRGAHGVV